MGFLDKAKAQATQLAAKAQEGLQQGQAKLEDVQAAKQADGLLRELGAWQWAAEHGRDDGTAVEELGRVRSQLQAFEAEHGPIPAPVTPPPAFGPTGAAVEGEQAVAGAPAGAPAQPPSQPAAASPPPPAPPVPPPAPASPAPPVGSSPEPPPEPPGGGFTLDDL